MARISDCIMSLIRWEKLMAPRIPKAARGAAACGGLTEGEEASEGFIAAWRK
ncbi:hypothetical protein D3C72_1483370 [compost metagenome]